MSRKTSEYPVVILIAIDFPLFFFVYLLAGKTIILITIELSRLNYVFTCQKDNYT